MYIVYYTYSFLSRFYQTNVDNIHMNNGEQIALIIKLIIQFYIKKTTQN